MRRIWFIFVLALFFSGCKNTADGMDGVLRLRRQIMQTQASSFLCEISADYGQEVYQFQMNCNFDEKGSMQFIVQQPESISGISGNIDNDGGKLIFDDDSLAFPLLADGYLSPISSPWVFMKTLRSGYLESCQPIDGGYCIIAKDSFQDKPLQLEIYTDMQFTPQSADFLWDGRRILSINIDQFQCM